MIIILSIVFFISLLNITRSMSFKEIVVSNSPRTIPSDVTVVSNEYVRSSYPGAVISKVKAIFFV